MKKPRFKILILSLIIFAVFYPKAAAVYAALTANMKCSTDICAPERSDFIFNQAKRNRSLINAAFLPTAYTVNNYLNKQLKKIIPITRNNDEVLIAIHAVMTAHGARLILDDESKGPLDSYSGGELDDYFGPTYALMYYINPSIFGYISGSGDSIIFVNLMHGEYLYGSANDLGVMKTPGQSKAIFDLAAVNLIYPNLNYFELGWPKQLFFSHFPSPRDDKICIGRPPEAFITKWARNYPK